MRPLILHVMQLACLALACGQPPDDPTSSSTGSDPTGSSSAGMSSTDAAAAQLDEYCQCMLERCHDQYHATWGEDHLASEAMCAAAAEAVPSVGEPATSGNSRECRLHYCQLGHDHPGACDSAIGGGACS